MNRKLKCYHKNKEKYNARKRAKRLELSEASSREAKDVERTKPLIKPPAVPVVSSLTDIGVSVGKAEKSSQTERMAVARRALSGILETEQNTKRVVGVEEFEDTFVEECEYVDVVQTVEKDKYEGLPKTEAVRRRKLDDLFDGGVVYDDA